MTGHSDDTWRRTGTIVTIESPWVRLLGETWIDHTGAALDYWRVERVPSIVVIAAWRGQVLLPQPQFRPGVQRATLDLVGGRVSDGTEPLAAAVALLKKELGIAAEQVRSVELLSPTPWLINSSFSNQVLYGAVAQIDERSEIDRSRVYRLAELTRAGVRALLEEIECLQCRAVLQEWLLRHELQAR